MKNLLILLCTVLSINKIVSQTIIKDTIYISKYNMSHLIFTDEPLHSDFGSGYIASKDNGIPVINKVGDTWLVILKAKKKFKNSTNISVVTDTKVYYDITCIYDEEKHDNFIPFDHGNPVKKAYKKENTYVVEKPVPDAIDIPVYSAKVKDSILDKEFNKFYKDTVPFKAIAKKLYSSNRGDLGPNIRRLSSQNEKIRLSAVGTYVKKDKLYIKLTIYNGGSLPYDIRHWDFMYSNNGGFNLQTSPKNEVKYIYEYNKKYSSILPKKSITKVFVFNDFSISKEHNFYAFMYEKNGERNLKLEFDNKYINSAKIIKR